MENQRAIFQVLLFLSLFIIISAENNCPISDHKLNQNYPKNFSIRFPFKLQNHPKNCGYPGFDLTVTTPENIATLNLPNSGEFSVRNVDYEKQEIQLYDPHNCLPNRLLTLNLSSSPFTASNYRNYTFLSCSHEVSVSKSSAIDCLSNSTAAVMATASQSLVMEMNTCAIIFDKPIPVTRPDQNDDFAGDLTLSWNLPGCADCEKKGDFCGFANATSTEIACFDAPKKGHHRSATFAGLMLVASVVGVIGICCCAVYCDIYRSERAERKRWERQILPRWGGLTLGPAAAYEPTI